MTFSAVSSCFVGAGGEESCEDVSSPTEKADLRRTRLDLICREYEVRQANRDKSIQCKTETAMQSEGSWTDRQMTD